MDKEKTTSVRSIFRAMDILDCISDKELSLKEISDKIGLAKTTTHRILGSLVQRSYVEQDPKTLKYRLGIELMRLGALAKTGFDIRREAIGVMEWLANHAGQTSNLYVLRNNCKRVCIEQVPGPNYMPRYSYLGATFSLHRGAGGKVLLAYMSKELREEYYSYVKATEDTSNNLVWIDNLERELEEIRKVGYMCSRGERDATTASASAPIYDYTGDVVASLTVSGPIEVFTPEKVERFVLLLLKASSQISQKLGYKV